jgi:hypothetical protein
MARQAAVPEVAIDIIDIVLVVAFLLTWDEALQRRNDGI